MNAIRLNIISVLRELLIQIKIPLSLRCETIEINRELTIIKDNLKATANSRVSYQDS